MLDAPINTKTLKVTVVFSVQIVKITYRIWPNTCTCSNNHTPTISFRFSHRSSDLYLPDMNIRLSTGPQPVCVPRSLCIKGQSLLPPGFLKKKSHLRCMGEYIHGQCITLLHWLLYECCFFLSIVEFVGDLDLLWLMTCHSKACRYSCLKILMHCICLSVPVFFYMWSHTMQLYTQVVAHHDHNLVDTWPLLSLLPIVRSTWHIISHTKNLLGSVFCEKCLGKYTRNINWAVADLMGFEVIS